MKIIEEVHIPLLADPPPNTHKLVKWTVPDGSYVSMGDIIYELEVDEVLYAVESFETGHIKFIADEGSCHEVGDRIAITACDHIRDGIRSIPVHLTEEMLRGLDSQRGDVHRQVFLTDLVHKMLLKNSDSEQNGVSNETPAASSGFD